MKTHAFDHCVATEEWKGEYPYSSVCTFTVKNKVGKMIVRWSFGTDINPRGETTLEECLRWCKYYIPKDMQLEELMDCLIKKHGYKKEHLKQVLADGMEAVRYFTFRRPLLSCPEMFPHMKKHNRFVWRKLYNERKFWREMGRSPSHLLLYRLKGVQFDYLHI